MFCPPPSFVLPPQLLRSSNIPTHYLETLIKKVFIAEGLRISHGFYFVFYINKKFLDEYLNMSNKEYDINKTSTIFFQSSWCFIKLTSSWIKYFGRISAWLDENCKVFINISFLCQFCFLLLIPYKNKLLLNIHS